MATITLGGNAITTSGKPSRKGNEGSGFYPDEGRPFEREPEGLRGEKENREYRASLDTGVCATSARKFDHEVAALSDTVLLTVSCDLPFAMARFCKAEGLTNVISLSQMRNRNFGHDWGVEMTSGPLAGILSPRPSSCWTRATKSCTPSRSPKSSKRPDYASALAAVKSA